MAGPMHKTVSALLISTLVVSACGTRLNPFNWFGRGEAAPTTAASANTNPLIPERTGIFDSRNNEVVYNGQPIDSISELAVERVPGGAIIRATGVAAVQGVHSVQLTPAEEDEQAVDGVLTYRLEGLRGPNTGAGTPASREVNVARKVTDQTLRDVRTIRVEAARNALQSRR